MNMKDFAIVHEYDGASGVFLSLDVKVDLVCSCGAGKPLSAGAAMFPKEELNGKAAGLGAQFAQRRDCSSCGATSAMPAAQQTELYNAIKQSCARATLRA